jgi:hypothetical protein
MAQNEQEEFDFYGKIKYSRFQIKFFIKKNHYFNILVNYENSPMYNIIGKITNII